jgi:3-hydroxyisobutyrate dehydrogenase-like beta-hydroxyacid dehydrogenase
MTSVGFIGLGAMGGRLAGRLLDAGYQVHGYNRTKDKASALIERGLIWNETPREVAAAVDIVFTMVTDDSALSLVNVGPDGILAGLRAGQVYVDMSTVSPAASIDMSRRVSDTGAQMLDAPVSGSVPQAESGTLTIMVGGDEHAFAIAEPVLSELGSKVTRIGGNGQGLVLKLAINISLAAQIVAFSEGLALAECSGIDSALAAEVMADSPIGSPMLKARVPMILELPAQAWFDVALLHKDIRLALVAARPLAQPLPSAHVADAVLNAAEQLGYAHRDIAAVHEVLAMHAAETAELIDQPERVTGA